VTVKRLGEMSELSTTVKRCTYHCAARGRHQQGHPQEIPGVLGIEPICFLIGTRSLSISQEAMARVKQRKQKPALLAHLKSRVAP
jgi:hypothetical protein